MASIYKPTRVDPDTGERIKYRCWRIAYIDENGIRKTVKGYKDKAATEAKAREIEKNIERLKAGLPVAEQGSKATEAAIEEYAAELIRRGSPPDGPHVYENRRQLKRLIAECNWPTLRAVTAATFGSWLAQRAAENMAPRTMNHYHTRLPLIPGLVRRSALDRGESDHQFETRQDRPERTPAPAPSVHGG